MFITIQHLQLENERESYWCFQRAHRNIHETSIKGGVYFSIITNSGEKNKNNILQYLLHDTNHILQEEKTYPHRL